MEIRRVFKYLDYMTLASSTLQSFKILGVRV
jgi:hypothetical protein